MIFRTNLSTLNIGLMMYGRRAGWQEAEATRKDFNTVLIRQDKKFFTFELSKVIQDAIPLILNCRTIYLFRTISSRNIKTRCIWVDINLAQKTGFKFYQTRSNAFILYDTLPAYCVPKAIMMETGEIIYEKVYASPRPPPKISFKDNWMKELGSEVAGGSEDSQQTQPKNQKPNCKHDETCEE